MAVYSYCITWAHERERLYEPTTLVEQTMQRRGSKNILFKRFEHSSFKHFIQAYKYKRDVRIGWIKDW